MLSDMPLLTPDTLTAVAHRIPATQPLHLEFAGAQRLAFYKLKGLYQTLYARVSCL
jgi:hypothetical protein